MSLTWTEAHAAHAATLREATRTVSPGRMKAEAAKIRALAGKKPPAARTLPCR